MKETLKEKLIKNNISIIVEGSWKDSYTIKPTCGHELTMAHNSIERNFKKNEGSFKCSKCDTESQMLSEGDIKKSISILSQREYKLISAEGYENSRTSKLDVLHKTCKTVFPITYSNFQLGKRCPHCASKSTESKAAQILKQMLRQIGLEFEEEKMFDNLRNPFTDYHLRYDIFIPSMDLIIEIDGAQHCIPIERFGGMRALAQTKWRDYVKNKYALRNNLKMYRIPLYNIKDKKIRRYEDVRKEIMNLTLDLQKLKKKMK